MFMCLSVSVSTRKLWRMEIRQNGKKTDSEDWFLYQCGDWFVYLCLWCLCDKNVFKSRPRFSKHDESLSFFLWASVSLGLISHQSWAGSFWALLLSFSLFLCCPFFVPHWMIRRINTHAQETHTEQLCRHTKSPEQHANRPVTVGKCSCLRRRWMRQIVAQLA